MVKDTLAANRTRQFSLFSRTCSLNRLQGRTSWTLQCIFSRTLSGASSDKKSISLEKKERKSPLSCLVTRPTVPFHLRQRVHPTSPHPTLRFGGKKLYLFQAFYNREWNTKHLKTGNVCSKNCLVFTPCNTVK